MLRDVLERLVEWERETPDPLNRPDWLAQLEAAAAAGLRVPYAEGRLARAFVSKFPPTRLKDPRMPWLQQPLVRAILRLDLPVYRDHFEFLLKGDDPWAIYQRAQHKRMGVLPGPRYAQITQLRKTYLEGGALDLGPRHESWLASLASYSVTDPQKVPFLRAWLRKYPEHPLLLGALGRALGMRTPSGIEALEQSLAVLDREGWFEDSMAKWEARKVLRDLVHGCAIADEQQRALRHWRRLVKIDPEVKTKPWARQFPWLPRD